MKLVEKKRSSIKDGNLRQIAHQDWTVFVPSGVTIDDVLDPAYLYNFCAGGNRVKPLDNIEIIQSDFDFIVEVKVKSVEKETQSVNFIILNGVDSKSAMTSKKVDLSDCVVEEKGGHKWRVRQDKKVLKYGFDTEAEAQAWLDKKKAA